MTGFDSVELPQPGTPPFLSKLLSAVRGAAPNLPLDPVVFQALLICYLAGDKNLIIRTREEDVGSLTKAVVSTLTAVFGHSTHKLKIRADSKHETPSKFLRSIFLQPAHTLSASDDASTSSCKQKTSHKRRSRTPSLVSVPKLQREMFQRSLSYPTEVPIGTPFTISPHPSGSPKNSPPKIQYVKHAESSMKRPSLRPLATDPPPALNRQMSLDSMTLPRALVVSGLEYTSVPAQRALLRALSERRVALEDHDGEWAWNLPEGFMIVYVCPTNPRERPNIYKSLLDRFAMSTTINLLPAIKQALRHNLSHSHTHLFSMATQSSPIPSSPPPILPESFLFSLRSLASPSRTFIHPTLSIYISDLFSATRHHHQLDAMSLTGRARKDVESLVRAGRVLGGDLTGVEFIRAMGKGAEAISTREAQLAEDEDYGSLGSEWEHLNESVFNQEGGQYPREEDCLDVSEADVARIVPRVLSHRLSVRDSPQDEILASLRYGAVTDEPIIHGDEWNINDAGSRATSERTTVKDILVQILAEV